LLGLCSQAERERIESEYFDNQTAFQAMLTAEDDLIDAYARGELTDEERRKFEKHFLTSMRGRERVQFARGFAGAVSYSPLVAMRAPATVLNNLKSFQWWLGAPRLAMVTAVIIMVIALSWLFVERRRTWNEPREAEVSKLSEALPRSADERTRDAQVTTQPEDLREHSVKPSRQNRAMGTQRTRHLQKIDNRHEIADGLAGVAGPVIGEARRVPRDVVELPLIKSDAIQPLNTQDAALGNNFERKDITQLPVNALSVTNLLSLQPDVARRGSFALEPRSSGRTTLTLASSVKTIKLLLRLETRAQHREYRAAVETADGRLLTTVYWTQSPSTYLNIVDTPGIETVGLPSGDYVILLAGKEPNGSFVRVTEYSFKVIRY